MAWAAERGRMLMRFGLDWPQWDGRWTFVAFSLPDDVNRSGPVLRTGLRRLDMAQLFDGTVGLTPRPHPPAGRTASRAGRGRLDGARADVASLPAKSRDPIDAWDLTACRDDYRRWIAQLHKLIKRIDAGRVSPTESLVVRTSVTLAWRQFVYDDPRLPRELLPPDWPVAAAREAFIAVYDGLGPVAEARAPARSWPPTTFRPRASPATTPWRQRCRSRERALGQVGVVGVLRGPDVVRPHEPPGVHVRMAVAAIALRVVPDLVLAVVEVPVLEAREPAGRRVQPAHGDVVVGVDVDRRRHRGRRTPRRWSR